MKMRAGLKLWRRKPRQLPARAAASRPAAGWSRLKLTDSSPTAAMPLTPAARPSRPSSQLMALVMPTSQITVARRLNQSGRVSSAGASAAPPKGNSMLPMRTPSDHTARDTASCRASRGKGGRANRSSARPMEKKQRQPARVVQIRRSLLGSSSAKPPSSQVRARATLNPSTMPTPPRRTIGRVCCLRASGVSVKPQRSPQRRTTGTMSAVSRVATTRVSRAAALGL